MQTTPAAANPRVLWLMRFYYALSYGAAGFIFPFIALFYKQQGLTGTQMGLLGTIASLVGIISAPLLGRLADNLPNPRRVLQLCLFGSGLMFAILSQQSTFLWIAVITGVEAFIGLPISPLSDAQALGISDEKKGFGSIRLWGSVGWAVTAFTGGWMVERGGLLTVFIGYTALFWAAGALLQWVTGPNHGAPRNESPRLSMPEMIRSLFTNRALIGLAVSLSFLWLSNNGRERFETIYMKELGASDYLIGLVFTYPALMEIPLMLWADRLARRYNPGWVLGASIIIQALALAVVVFFPSIESLLFLRAASGLYFSFYAVASVAYAVQHAPGSQGSTVLSLYFITLPGIISLVASPISGVIYDRAGAYPLYIIAAAGSFISWLVFILIPSTRRVETQPAEY